MKHLIQGLIILSLAVLFTACSNTQNVNLTTANGFKTKSTLYTKKESNKDYLFILLHGKGGNVKSNYRVEAYENFASKGYEVLVPKMPWSKDWEGTLDQGLELIDSSIEYALKRNKKPILVGHSLGGAISIIYASKNPNKDLLGVVVVAPGHMIHQSQKMQDISEKSLAKAKKMIKNNQGNQKAYFTMLNTGKIKKVNMKANVFQSYFDTASFPDTRDLLEDINKPFLWIAGKNDRLTSTYSMSDLFELLPENDNNEYIEIKGSHKKVLPNSSEKIISWTKSLD